jgi:hypothetical protein
MIIEREWRMKINNIKDKEILSLAKKYFEKKKYVFYPNTIDFNIQITHFESENSYEYEEKYFLSCDREGCWSEYTIGGDFFIKEFDELNSIKEWLVLQIYDLERTGDE